MQPIQPTIKGRGAAHNPPNRFERLHIEPDPDGHNLEGGEQAPPQATYLRDASRSIIASNNSPDIPFQFSINPYRGCTHGCIYCFARPSHEYLGFSAGLDFETKIMVKLDAPELLRRELSGRRWQPRVVCIGTNTDAYQPIERKLELTRRCLEVFYEFRNPATVISKNYLITRDIDLLSADEEREGESVHQGPRRDTKMKEGGGRRRRGEREGQARAGAGRRRKR
ncbi:MAG TPA: hypothetical protein VHS28_04745 [Chloroflexota bacterium]|nr:hypothetical protein [Chloroflexota bacterium]